MKWPGIKSNQATPLIPVLVLWILIWWQQSYFWRSTPDAYYGWCVPFLQLYLFLEAWASRPPSGAPLSGKSYSALLTLSSAAIAVALVLLNPFPTWPSALWLLAFGSMGFSLVLLARQGGVPWMRHFAWTIGFSLCALPWPAVFQLAIVEHIRPWIAYVAAACVDIVSGPAQASGTAILVSTGQLRIDEACSGILSLQASVMTSVFLCEYFRLRPLWRATLVIGGISVAVLANLLRTTFLGILAARYDVGTATRWHDAVAFGELAAVFTAIVGIALVLARRPSGACLTSPLIAATDRLSPRSTRIGALFFPLFLLLAIEVTTTLAFNHSLRTSPPSRHIHWPGKAAEVTVLPVSAETRALLHTNHITIEAWRSPTGGKRAAYELEWNNAIVAQEVLELHNPSVCLPAAGAKLISHLPPLDVLTRHGMLRFERLRFRDANGTFEICSLRLLPSEPRTMRIWNKMDWWRQHLREVLRGKGDYRYFSLAAWEPVDDAMLRAELIQLWGN